MVNSSLQLPEAVADYTQESPHDREQSLLLQRIVNNVVCFRRSCIASTWWLILGQEKLNEAVLEMNKRLQVRLLI